MLCVFFPSSESSQYPRECRPTVNSLYSNKKQKEKEFNELAQSHGTICKDSVRIVVVIETTVILRELLSLAS